MPQKCTFKLRNPFGRFPTYFVSVFVSTYCLHKFIKGFLTKEKTRQNLVQKANQTFHNKHTLSDKIVSISIPHDHNAPISSR